MTCNTKSTVLNIILLIKHASYITWYQWTIWTFCTAFNNINWYQWTMDFLYYCLMADLSPHRTISNSLKTWKLWKTWWPLTITKIHLKCIVPCSLILLIKKGPLTCCQLPTQNMQIYISLQLYYTSKYIKPFKLLPVIIAWRQAR